MKHRSQFEVASHALILINLALSTSALRTLRDANKNTNSTNSLIPQDQVEKGLLCREVGTDGDDIEVAFLGGGMRSLAFSRVVKSVEGEILGRELHGEQSKVLCEAPPGQRCVPPGNSHSVPSCSSMDTLGSSCGCIAKTTELPPLPYQSQMMSTTMAYCNAKAKLNQTFNVLVFGLGGGAMPMYLRHNCQAAQVESVEISDKVAMIAKKFLGFAPDGKNTLEIADGVEAVWRHAQTHFKQGSDRPYDFVLVDCFTADGRIPSGCGSEGFVTKVRSILAPGGRVLQNVLAADTNKVFPLYRASFGDAGVRVGTVGKSAGQFILEASVLGE